MASGTLKLSVNTRYAVLWLRAMRWLAYIVGPERAMRMGEWGGTRLTRYRLGNGRWQWLRLTCSCGDIYNTAPPFPCPVHDRETP